MEFYASCPEGFESALADELKRLGLSHVRRLKGRATFEGELEEGYRACLWSRLASRVFAVLGRFEAQDADELYDSVYDIAWENIVRPGATIAITARGVTEQLRNTRFSALRAKDALCDRLAENTGRRADVDAADPDVHLLLSLRQRRASISLDLSGDPLFKRLPPAATRAGEGAHVLRPDYAALVLAQVGWTALCERELTADDYEDEALPTIIDASCAGGGLLLEAVNILTDRAPGATRERWGFEGWQLHDAALWEQLLAEAREREAAARERQARIVAVDIDPAARKTAERMVKCAGYKRFVDFCAAKPATVLDHVGAVAGAAVVADTTETPLSLMHDAMTLIGELRRAPELASAPVAALTRDGLMARALHAEPARSLPSPRAPLPSCPITRRRLLRFGPRSTTPPRHLKLRPAQMPRSRPQTLKTKPPTPPCPNLLPRSTWATASRCPCSSRSPSSSPTACARMPVCAASGPSARA